MANYAYLYSCETGLLPQLHQLRESRDDSYPPRSAETVWYEAKYSIPLFWLMLFDVSHIQRLYFVEEDEEREDASLLTDDLSATDAHSYVTLLAPVEEALQNAKRRTPVLMEVLKPREQALYTEFVSRAATFGPFIVVDLEEVIWMEGVPGETRQHLEQFLRNLDTLLPEQLEREVARYNAIALPGGIAEAPWYDLVGYDETTDWPNEPESSLPTGDAERPAVDMHPLDALLMLGKRASKPFVYSDAVLSNQYSLWTWLCLIGSLTVPVWMGYVLTWWSVMLIPIFFFMTLLFVEVPHSIQINFREKTLRCAGKEYAFTQLFQEDFLCRKMKGEWQVVCRKEGVERVLTGFKGPEAEELARTFIRRLLSLCLE